MEEPEDGRVRVDMSVHPRDFDPVLVERCIGVINHSAGEMPHELADYVVRLVMQTLGFEPLRRTLQRIAHEFGHDDTAHPEGPCAGCIAAEALDRANVASFTPPTDQSRSRADSWVSAT